MANGQDGLFHDVAFGLDYVWLDGGVVHGGTPDGGRTLSFTATDALHAAVAEAILRSPWPLRGAELRWLRSLLEMGHAAFARSSGLLPAKLASLEADLAGELDREADGTIRRLVATLLRLDPTLVAAPAPQPGGAERCIVARHEPGAGRWTAVFEDVPSEEDRVVGLAEASDDPLVRSLLALLRSHEASARRANDLLAADLSLLRAGPSEMGFTMEAAGRAVAILAGQMATWLRGHGAQNYTETEFSHYEAPFTVTVQRRTGTTPHQFRQEAEAKAAVLEAALLGAARALGGDAIPTFDAALADASDPVGGGAATPAWVDRLREELGRA